MVTENFKIKDNFIGRKPKRASDSEIVCINETQFCNRRRGGGGKMTTKNASSHFTFGIVDRN